MSDKMRDSNPNRDRADNPNGTRDAEGRPRKNSGGPNHNKSKRIDKEANLEEEEDDFSPDEPVEIPIEDAIDLHLFTPRDVKVVVLEYLEQAAAKGFEEVRIIHGRGIGERRRQVQDLLKGHPLVADFRDAPGGRGGWGATIVWLRKPPAGS